MGVPRFKPPPRINYQTRSERISASSLSNARDRFCVVSLSPCDFFPEFLQVRYTGVNRERWWLRAMELFRSMGHSSMSIPRSRWNDRKFMEGERTRGWTKRETVYEFMTAARGLVRFISQYKFFFLSLSFYFFFFSSLHDGQKSPIPSMRSQSLSMPDASTTGVQYSRPRREKEGKRKHEKEAGERAAKRSYDGFRAAGGFFPPSFFPPRGSPFSHRSHRGSCTHLVAFQLLLSLLLL